ncbi:Ubiquitin-like-specific protease 1A [Hibiscus syriacus]|uniref:Ubiquitin-like-specific protease 1A n=1 Tax=Hibiscus syriacus TaxID=106335 RepID=A0A6A2Y2G9_HIBSY|nr:ubiquitin-like-specific protease 1A [Hibiscus syriacus]KAE8669636.1 Ubiquitin-like-specific protease 1A [Hibiscus syriacus]
MVNAFDKLSLDHEVIHSELFYPLTKEEMAEVSHAFSARNKKRVLVSHENSSIDIRGEVLQCLKPDKWLNDEVINLYLELLKERENREPKKFLKCHFFNTFFYKKLVNPESGYNYKAVKRCTSQRKLGYCLFDCDKIFVPIHKDVHWCLAVINKKYQKFQYLDSLRGRDAEVLNALANYFVEEVRDKSGVDIDVSSWEQEYVEDLPTQKNGFDCGMFMLKYIDFYSRGLSLCFDQKHMPDFRLRTAKEILSLKAD